MNTINNIHNLYYDNKIKQNNESKHTYIKNTEEKINSKIERIKQEIENGTYQVDKRIIANSICNYLI